MASGISGASFTYCISGNSGASGSAVRVATDLYELLASWTDLPATFEITIGTPQTHLSYRSDESGVDRFNSDQVPFTLLFRAQYFDTQVRYVHHFHLCFCGESHIFRRPTHSDFKRNPAEIRPFTQRTFQHPSETINE